MKIEATIPPPPPAPPPPPPEVTTADSTLGLGAAIKRIRVARGMRQAEIAEKAGIDRTSVCNIECGRQRLSVMTLHALAEALDMTLLIKLVPKP